MSNVIIVAEISEKNGWVNIKTNEGKEVSIMLSKCPKLAEQVKTVKAGDELTGKLVEKDGKNYLWDLDEKKSNGGFGGKSFTPKNQAREAALSAAIATGNALALQKDVTLDKFKEFAEGVHSWIMSKSDASK